MAGSISKAVLRARKSLDQVVAKQKRKRAMAKAGGALKTAGKAAAIVGVLAGTAYAVRAVSNKRAEVKKATTKKKRVLAAAATAVGATAIASRVRRNKER